MRCRTLVRILTCCVLVVLASAVARAAVKLPAVIGDNMVLQRGRPVPIWGWADKGEEVTVTIAGQKHVTKAGNDGRWKVTLPKLDTTVTDVEVATKMPKGAHDYMSIKRPLTMTVEGSSGDKITVKHILVGRGLGLLRPVEHGDGHRRVQRCRQGDRRREVSTNPPVHGRKGESGATGHRREGQVDALLSTDRCRRRLGRILGDGLLLRAATVQRVESADRPDPHLVGRHAGRVLDQPQGPGSESRAEAVGPGRIVVPVQRHDRPVDSLRHPRRDLVSRRVERRRGLPLPHALSRDDRQLAGRLGPGRFPLRFRADRPVQLSQGLESRSGVLSRIVGSRSG